MGVSIRTAVLTGEQRVPPGTPWGRAGTLFRCESDSIFIRGGGLNAFQNLTRWVHDGEKRPDFSVVLCAPFVPSVLRFSDTRCYCGDPEFAAGEPALLLTSLPQHSGRAGKLERSHPPPRA